MKVTRTLLVGAIAALLAACGSGADNGNNPSQAGSAMMPAQSATSAGAANMGATDNNAGMMAGNSSSSATPGMAGTSANASQSGATNWFGGPIYTGEPALKATAALVKAGGGADNFSFAQALNAMLGEDTVKAEVDKLDKQYGKEAVQHFLDGMTFAVNDGLKRATEAGVSLPTPPDDLTGKKLAGALVDAGTAPDGTFWAGYMFDHAISHKLHNQVMADIDAKFSHEADKNTHKILNQAMYDVAQALGKKDVKLADLH